LLLLLQQEHLLSSNECNSTSSGGGGKRKHLEAGTRNTVQRREPKTRRAGTEKSKGAGTEKPNPGKKECWEGKTPFWEPDNPNPKN